MAWLWATRSWATMAAGHLNSRFLTPNREAGRFCLEALAADDGLGESFARTAARFLGARLVDFVGALGAVSQDQDLVTCDLEKAAAHGHGLFGAAPLDADHARLEGGQQGRVARQDADNAFGAGCDDHVDGVVGKYFPFRRDDLHF